MNGDFYIGEKKYISAKRAAKLTGYAMDYIGQLARAGKLDAQIVGRSWFVAEESLLGYKREIVDTVFSAEKSARKRGKKSSRKVARKARQTALSNVPATGTKDVRLKFVSRTLTGKLSASDSAAGRPRRRRRSAAPALPVAATPREVAPLQAAALPEPVRSVMLPVVASMPSFAKPGVVRTVGNVLLSSMVGAAMFALVLSAGVLYKMTEEATVAMGESVRRSGELVDASLARSPEYLSAGIAAVSGAFEGDAARHAKASWLASLAAKAKRDFNGLALGFYESVNFFLGVPVKIDVRVGKLATHADTRTQAEPGAGMVVIPSTGSKEKDELIVERVKETFSDEVEVTIEDEATGVVKPVFKGGKGDEYMYVLVPIGDGG